MSDTPEPLPAEAARTWMLRALDLAARARREGEVPVGAVVLDAEGRLLAEGWNRTVGLQDPTAHAEALALRRAAAVRRNPRLDGAILVTTLEPCLMCLGALLEARVAAILSGADDPRRGALDLARDRGFQGPIVRGVEAAACAEVLLRYFRDKRRGDAAAPARPGGGPGGGPGPDPGARRAGPPNSPAGGAAPGPGGREHR